MAVDISEQLSKLSIEPGGQNEYENVVQDCTTRRTILSWGPLEHIAYYSCDSAGNISYDLSALHTFASPPLPADLYQGRQECYYLHKHNQFFGHPVPLDNMVGACKAFDQEDKLRNADVVTWRGLLVKLMLGKRIDLQFSAVNGVLHLIEYDRTPHTIHTKQLLDGYQGYAFESLCTRSASKLTAGESLPTLDLWKCIVYRSFGDLKIVFGGEVDCVTDEYDGTSKNFLEMKTARLEAVPRDRRKWYLQSFLMGVPELCIGYWDGEHILRKTQVIPLEKVYDPQEGTLEKLYEQAYGVLKELRTFCAAQACMGSDNRYTWTVAVGHGSLLTPPRRLKRHR